MDSCPLCLKRGPFALVIGPGNRRLLHCETCNVVFTPHELLPSPDAEKARYLLHQNDARDQGYVRFLGQAITAVRPHFRHGARALDFGCGPNPTLCVLLGKEEIACDNYDPFFFPESPGITQAQTGTKSQAVDAAADNGVYDFIFAIETFEHFHEPKKEIRFIRRLLKPGGTLVVMTEKWASLDTFSRWHYAHDVTHVIFFHADTFRYIGRTFGFDLLECANPRVTMLRKQ